MREFSLEFLALSVGVFLLTVLAEWRLIPVLRSHKAGQRILEIGPRWHKAKEGTPTMGGIGFILAALIGASAFFILRAVRGTAMTEVPLALTLAFAVGNGAIGFVDDYCKLVKKQNEGLTWYQKLILQIAVAAAYVSVMSYMGFVDTSVDLPFSSKAWELGWFFYPVSILVLVGVVNGGNLTDGIDGLASSVTFVIGGLFALVAFAWRDPSVGLVSAILLGATLGFLVYNFHPAKVFMGDTGSLFLGALVIGGAFMLRAHFVGLILCGVFIFEMLSSFLQVIYFKLTHGKRLFRMAPFHHHLEKCGWNEYAIVAFFTVCEILLCILGWFALGV
ncbi:MAG: phospho-N-acetylmuramoyl-pentapeptide-transferase [Clostridia bacterium]|nr:phospho-N-acetylmuramoyl-pentapeptide-transferase [Clostridia bacterium]